jgi:parallel beta-helix repeat protein
VGDRVEDVIIQGNIIDCRETPIDAGGRKVLNAIALNNGNGASPWKNIQALENEILSTIRAGGVGYAGILVRSSVGAVVARNTLTRCIRGILVDSGSRSNRIEQNTLRSCASGSTAAIEIQDTSRGNIVRGNQLVALPGDGFEEVAGRIWSVPGNVIENNAGATK